MADFFQAYTMPHSPEVRRIRLALRLLTCDEQVLTENLHVDLAIRALRSALTGESLQEQQEEDTLDD